MTAAPPAGAPDGGDAVDGDATVSWRELLQESVARLQSSGLPDAHGDARRIVAEAAGVGDAELRLHLDRPATIRGVARLDRMCARRADGEPLQYVLGRWAFRSLDLMVDRRVLIPRPETEHVVTVAIDELDRLGGRERATTVVDLGTGSGAIALSIATERVRTSVWATDSSPDALEVARANLAGTGRCGARVRLELGDWFDALPEDLLGRVDLIVSNPPYVPDDAVLGAEVVDWEPAAALFGGPDGRRDLDRIVVGSAAWLTDAGALVCELSPEQGDGVARAAERCFEEVSLVEDLTGRIRAVVARRPRR